MVYLSFASDGIDEMAIKDILNKARAKNSDKGISGMLLFKGGVFLQLLEGLKDDVRQLYKKIEVDGRHQNLKILIETDINEKRIFDSWTMAYKEISGPDLELINTILPWAKIVDCDPSEYNNKLILDIIKQFRYQLG